MRRALRSLPARSKLILLFSAPLLAALAAAGAGLVPSSWLGDPLPIERRGREVEAYFSQLLEQAAARAARVLESSPTEAFAAALPGRLSERLEGVGLLAPDLTFLDWEGRPATPAPPFADPAAAAFELRVEGARTRLLARAGPDSQGYLAVASFVIDSTLDDLDYLRLLPHALRRGVRMEARFGESVDVPDPEKELDPTAAGAFISLLRSPQGDFLGTLRIEPIPLERRRETWSRVGRAGGVALLLLAFLCGVEWRPLVERGAGMLAALLTLAAGRARLVAQDVAARLLPRELGSPELYGSPAAWGLLASPGDLLLTAAALYLGCRALRCFAVALAARRRRVAAAIAAGGFALECAIGTGLVLSMARDSGVPLLARPAPFNADGRLLLWIALVLAALGAAELFCLLPALLRGGRRGHAAGRPAVLLASVVWLALATALLARAEERMAIEQLSHDSAPQVLEQESRRRVALLASMRGIAAGRRFAARLAHHSSVPSEFLAYDAWVSGELFHSRFKSSIDIYTPAGELLSHFGFDLPPFEEQIEPAAGPRGPLEVAEETFQVGVADERKLLHLEVPVLHEGEVVALVVGHVLDEPDNLPVLPWAQPYLAALGPGLPGPRAFGEIEPDYVLYDGGGAAVLTTMRPPPAIAEVLRSLDGERLLDLTVGEERYHGLALADGERLHLLLLRRASALERWATAVRLALLSLLVLLALEGPARLFRSGVRKDLILLLRGSFYRKLVAAMLVASIAPLVGLALFLGGYIERRASAELVSASAQYVGAARQLVEDLSLQSIGQDPDSSAPDDILLYWLRSVVGQEIHLYRQGLLVASSKRELFASGLLPPRIDGLAQRRLIDLGLPTTVLSATLGPIRIPVAYAPVRPGGDSSLGLIVAVPLVLEQREIAGEAAEVAEMILLATVVVVGLLAVAAAFVARTVARPVAELVDATSRIAAGSYQTRLEPSTRDEVAELFRGFNAMATALGQQRADLERRSRYIETLLHNATTGVVSLDPAGSIVTLNPAAGRLLGAAGGRLRVGERLQEALDSAEALRPVARWLEPAAGARPATPVDVDLQQEREPRRLRLVQVELRGAAGDSVGTMVLLDDVTDMMRSNQLAAWAEMARSIAHEIKNPLTPIQLSAEHLLKLLRDGGRPPTAEEEACLETILKQVRALYGIAGEFSAFAKLPDLAPEPTDPVAFMREVIAPYRAGSPLGVTIEESYEPAPPVRIDRRVLSRALVNLVENALQAMERGGTLSVAVRGSQNNGSVELIVSDSGPGLDARARRRLFEPYFSTKSSGTGLGLAIVRRAVEAHRGQITVWSEQGRGTAFTISLPADTT